MLQNGGVFKEGKAIIILKILLLILLTVLALLFLLCLVRVKITVGNTDSFYYKLHLCGIRIKPEWFFGKKQKKDSSEKESRKKERSGRKKTKSSKASHTCEDKTKTKKKNIGQTLALISRIASTAGKTLPKVFRIKLKYLNITAGAPQAEQTAVIYGRIHWILASLFALFDGYKGLLYGFHAKRNKVVINADFLSDKTKAEFEMTVSFFVWQLLFAGTRIGISAIAQIIENASEDSSDSDTAISDAEEILQNTKSK